MDIIDKNIKEWEDKPISEQTDEELRHNIAQIQRIWYERKGKTEEHKQFDRLLEEILRRRNQKER